MSGSTVRGLLELTRPANAVLAGGLTAIGGYVAGGVPGAARTVGIAVLATVFATGAGNAINDYFDRDIDRINRPDRPIPRGAVDPREALVWSAVLFGLAVALALVLPLLAIVIAGVNLFLLVTYTTLFKGRPGAGNLVVSVLGGSTFLFGGAAVGEVGPTTVLFLLAALATFGREVVKDVEDRRGDAAEGLRTLPIVFGRRPALIVAGTSTALGLLASPIPYFRGAFGWPYLIVLTPGVTALAGGMALAVRDPGRGQRIMKAGMAVAALAFVVGRATAG